MQSFSDYQPNSQQQYMLQTPIVDDSVTHPGGEEDGSDGSGMPDKRSRARKIKIEYINDKSKRHITFSKRKAGIMKKAYELSTLTGTQVLLLVVSETGLVYTFTTAKLQPLVATSQGKNLIQSCLGDPFDSIEPTSSSSMDHRPVLDATSPPTANSNYYSPNQSLDFNNNYSTFSDEGKSFGNMFNSAPSSGPEHLQQMSSNFNFMAYPSYSSSNSAMLSYNLQVQPQGANTNKRQDNV